MKDNLGYVGKNNNVRGIIIAAFAGLICLAAITIGVVSLNKRSDRNERSTEDVVDLNNVKKNTDNNASKQPAEEKDSEEENEEHTTTDSSKATEGETVLDDTPTENIAVVNSGQTGETENTTVDNIADFGTAQAVAGDVNNEESTPAPEINEEESVAADVAAMVAGYSFNESDTLEWPVRGNVILDYSMESTIYFPTLDSYRCNPAIVIQSENGANVCAGVNGVVKEVSANDEIGKYVVVGIGSGYEITYGQLDNINVTAGTVVEPATIIGVVGEVTRYYKNEGPNIYYEVTKDGQPCDPLDYLR